MIFAKTFKGYENQVSDLDASTNAWIEQHQVDVVDIKAVLSHEPGGRAGSGDLVYLVLYRGDAPIS